MSYFNRLTDIVTCNLTEMLRREDDPQSALSRIIEEMEEGLGGARRSVATATRNVDRLRTEIEEHQSRIAEWIDKAKTELEAGNEDAARAALSRKQEVSDLIAGLEQQLSAAESTRTHLSTTLRALEARLTEAQRTRTQFETDVDTPPKPAVAEEPPPQPSDAERADQVEAELAELKRMLGSS
ncbi:PspA/IM30 family protein [Thalassoroseus pseudoceratinae]|uniref:PspA/IM30 family protein n=1 Tax=Thalassoroseus pseudoceratinae TaxID=2713176 RepID=UPI0014207C16|nr:PspA/IM30 family protein [Thalassoroseus pseudoceratinae]